jgi:GNAT superfamily N-acetyltransferase
LSNYRIYINPEKSVERDGFILKGILGRPSTIFSYLLTGDFFLQKILPFLLLVALVWAIDRKWNLNAPGQILLFSSTYLLVLLYLLIRNRISGEIIVLPCYKENIQVGGIRIAVNPRLKRFTLIGLYVAEAERGQKIGTALLYGCYLYLEQVYKLEDFKLRVYAPVHGVSKRFHSLYVPLSPGEAPKRLKEKLLHRPQFTFIG